METHKEITHWISKNAFLLKKWNEMQMRKNFNNEAAFTLKKVHFGKFFNNEGKNRVGHNMQRERELYI